MKDMIRRIGQKALIQNPALKPFEILIGTWKTEGSHPYFPDTVLHGYTSFEWIEGGAFIKVHSEVNHAKFPDGIAILGSDDNAETFYQLYFDERGISRRYDIEVKDGQIVWSRNNPEFSQRNTMTIEEDGNRLTAVGEMSRDGGTWEKDLSLTYTRQSE